VLKTLDVEKAFFPRDHNPQRPSRYQEETQSMTWPLEEFDFQGKIAQ
jgi:hypothetical protein